MKTWIVCDKDGISLFTGKNKPFWDERNKIFSWYDHNTWNSLDGEWYEESVLKDLHINYPKNLKIGDCKEFHINIKTNWK